MADGEQRRGIACISHLQTQELKSTHQVKMLFDLLPPHDPLVPVDRKRMVSDTFLAFSTVWSETSGASCII